MMRKLNPFNENILNFIVKFRIYIAIVIIAILSLCSFKSYSSEPVQNMNFPRLEYVNDTLCIIFTYHQGQLIEADLQLLENYKLLAIESEKNINMQIEIIDDYKNVIIMHQEKIKNQDKVIDQFVIAVNNLNLAIETKNKELKLADQQIQKLELLVKDTEKKLRKEKRKNVFTYVSSGVVVIGTVLFFIFK